jgi:hypothetical protein
MSMLQPWLLSQRHPSANSRASTQKRMHGYMQTKASRTVLLTVVVGNYYHVRTHVASPLCHYCSYHGRPRYQPLPDC